MAANEYINIAHLYKRVPVLTDTNGDHLISVSDLRTAIALAAAETGEVHPIPCKIGDKVYTVRTISGTTSHLTNSEMSGIWAMRLIDANALIKEAERHTVPISPKDTPHDAVRNMGRKFRELIENAPTVTPTETTDFGDMIAKTNVEIERLAKELDEHMKAMKDELWRPADDPPDAFFDENIGLIPFLVCLDGTKLPFRAVYDGTNWSDGISASVLPVKWWMPLPEPPVTKGE